MTDDRWVRDQLEIRTLIERYSDAACRRDSATLMTLWADECRWSVPDMKGLENVVGKAAIKQTFDGAQALFPFVWLVCIPGYVEVTGETAVARSYTTEVLKDTAGTVRKAVGRYDDKFARINGKWYFTERTWWLQHMDG